VSVIDRILDAKDRAASVSETSRDESQNQKVQAIAGVKIALLVLNALASPKALLESAQTHALQQRGMGQGDKGKFSPSEIFVKLRSAILPVSHRIWKAGWLPESPAPIVTMAARTFLLIMEAKNEDASDSVSSAVAIQPPIPRAPPTADPIRVNHLVEMGFEQATAEFALVRARNNVGAAADLILSMPHLFQTAPSPPLDVPSPGEVPGAPAADISSQNPDVVSEPAHTAEADMDVDATESVSEPSVRDILGQRREECRPDMASRAVILLDHNEDLVFVLMPAFPPGVEGEMYLLDRAYDVASDYQSANEAAVSARFRLLAIRLRSAFGAFLCQGSKSRIAEVLRCLMSKTGERPSWLSAFLLLAECALAVSTPVSDVKIGDDPQAPVVINESPLAELSGRLVSLCMEIVSDTSATTANLTSALRLLVVLSRGWTPNNETIAALLGAFRQSQAKVHSLHPLLAMIVRHAFEDETILKDTMRGEIRQWFALNRGKTADVNLFLRQLRQVALRHSSLFVDSIEKECALVDPTPPQSVFQIRDRAFESKPPSALSDPFRDTETRDPRKAVMISLLAELGRAVQMSQGWIVDESTPSSDEMTASHSHAGLLLSLLTELLGSYLPAKQSFMSSIRQQSSLGSHKGKYGLSIVMNDLICCITLRNDLAVTFGTQRSIDSTRRLAISGWSVTMIVGLCCDVNPIFPRKDLAQELTSIRRMVLDAIAKSFKDTTQSDLSVRYGRLWALGELTYRLLVSKPSVIPAQSDDSSLHMAKLMLEKNFVSLLTTAIGDVDLNYPDIRIVLVSQLRALEHLYVYTPKCVVKLTLFRSKVSIKWGKVEKSSGDRKATAGSPSLSSDSESDVEIAEEDEHTPDLYRNSALGM